MTRGLAKGQQEKPTRNINPLLGKKPKISVPVGLLTVQLSDAATKGDIEKAKSLLEEGADINGKGVEWPPLVMAAVGKQTEMLLFLGERGADTEVKDNLEGRTALHWAAVNGFFECVVALINLDAHTDVEDNMKRTAWDLAITNRHYQVAEFLEEK